MREVYNTPRQTRGEPSALGGTSIAASPAPDPATPIEQAVALVIRSLEASVALRRDALTLESQRLRRFGSFARLLDAQTLDGVSPQVAAAFVNARRSTGERATEGERHERLCSLHRLYAVARRLGLATGDPAMDIGLPRLRHVAARALTDHEVEVGRTFADSKGDPYPGVAWALAECTARPSEIASIRVGDVNLTAGRVWVHGARVAVPREALISAWGLDRIGRRIASLAAEPGDPLLATDRSYADQVRASNAVTVSLRVVLRRAALVGLGVSPRSIVAWVGDRAMRDGARIEEVARRLGMRSLDQAAALVGFDWRDAP